MARRKKQNKQAPKPNFVLINRSIFEWEWWGDIYVTHFFIGLILLANHEDKMVRGIKVKRGQHLTSISKLENSLLLKRDCILNCIKKLESSGEIIDDVKPNKYRIITIVNYDKFQGVIGKTDNSTDNSTDTNNKYISNDIYIKEKKVSVAPTGQTDTIKKESTPSAVSPSGEPPAAFDYEAIDWHKVQEFKGGEGKDLVYGHIPIRSVRRFAKAQGIDDYTASDFHSAFRKSKTPFPRHWEELFVRYSKADSKQQTEFEKRLLNGEYIEKWTE